MDLQLRHVGADGDEAFYEWFDVGCVVAPEVCGFFLNVDDGVVGAECAVDEVAAVDFGFGEVCWCCGCCEGGFEDRGMVCAFRGVEASETGGCACFLKVGADESEDWSEDSSVM